MPHPLSSEKIVVTGGTGFIGRHLLRALVDGGHRPVALSRNSDNDETEFAESVRWNKLDLLDTETIGRFIEVERPSLIFHLAGTKGRNHQDAPADCKTLNVDATASLLKAASGAKTRRTIIVGSAEEYGNQSGPLNEDIVLRPISEYGKSKADATRLALEMHRREALGVVVLRLFTVYGPHQPKGMFVSDAIDSAVNDRAFAMSDGTQQRDLVHVDDVVGALLSAATANKIDGQVFNVGSGTPTSLLDVAKAIWRISETKATLNVGARARRDDEMQVTWADTSRAQSVLGWAPCVDLENGLQSTIDWARNRVGKLESELAAR